MKRFVCAALLFGGLAAYAFGQALPFPGPGMGGGACTWHNLFSPVTQTTGGAGFTSYNIRSFSPVSVYTSPQNAGQVRVSIKAPSGGATVNLLYVGHSTTIGDDTDHYTFNGTQVQGKFSSSASVVIGTNATVVSDAIVYSFNKTKDFIVSIGWGTSAITSNAATGNGMFATRAVGLSSSAGANSSTPDTGTALANSYYLVPLVEICF